MLPSTVLVQNGQTRAVEVCLGRRYLMISSAHIEQNKSHTYKYFIHIFSLFPLHVFLFFSVHSFLIDGLLDISLMVDPLSYFSFKSVLNHWYNKGRGMHYPGMVHIEDSLHIKE